jgi:predicted nucleic acid-binding protein
MRPQDRHWLSFLAFPLTLVSFPLRNYQPHAALDLALTYDLSVYDACYVAAVRQHKAALVTADQKLVERLVNTEVKVLW